MIDLGYKRSFGIARVFAKLIKIVRDSRADEISGQVKKEMIAGI